MEGRIKVDLWPVGGAVKRALSNANTRWSDREGLFVRLTDETGSTGWGEASPLPGYSLETLEDSRRALESIELFSSAASSIEEIQHCVDSLPPTLPSAKFGLETALLDLRSRECGTSVSELIGKTPLPFRRCALLPYSSTADRHLLDSAQALLDRGITTAKLKVGRNWAGELDSIRSIRSSFPELTLRIDVNAAWSVAQASENLSDLPGLGIEFVEQPVSPENMSQLAHSPVPLAADESLRDGAKIASLQALVDTSVLVALVLKPTVLGGIFACLKHRVWAQENGIHCIASHCFEGPVAMAAIAEFAMILGSPIAAGVDSHDALSAFPAISIPQLLTSPARPHCPGLGVIPIL